MSAGRASEGAGCISWWGFSPALDLLKTGPVTKRDGNFNVLLIGCADQRHILKTISGLQNGENLNIWVIENSMEVVARQLLLLYVALMPKEIFGFNEKTELYLEVFGNSEIRCQTAEMLRRAASQLSLCVTESMETPTHPCLNTTHLKFREQDELARIFKLWTQPHSSKSLSEASGLLPMSKLWDNRVRQHLGTRYDFRKGCFDWDLTMKLHEKGCCTINKQEYTQWRGSGLAFEMREGIYQVPNPSLLSFRVFSQGGNKVAARGYWGDIVSSPYLSFGIKTDDKSLLKTQNGQQVKTAQDVSYANVQMMFQSLLSRLKSSSTSPSEPKEPKAQTDLTINDLMHLTGVSVTFLPMDSLQKLSQKKQYESLFDIIYLSARYILDLDKEQEAGFSQRVMRIALDAGFEPWQNNSDSNDDNAHSVFTLQQKK
ncbi:dynein assembly factor 3, axonemal isoform X2 [Cynoglossus semilaevis]|uniref:dynein assembly factor 3, axonemal isoform X2 n=1 Tax=Cynoglossus semilaevis TaxID=244447 RepID=UPI000496FE48|nr:dynein assembly factor 3, axonemal-like isoform X2 [Cynoglossus semilaevis]